MERQRWLELNMLALADWFAATAGRSPGSSLIELDGIVAVVNPQIPERSVFNSVACTDPAALEANYEEIAAAYADAGCAWTVWLRPDHAATAALLEGKGHTLDAQPRAMGAELSAVGEPDLDGVEWTSEGAVDQLLAINDRAYGYADGTWRRGLGALPDPTYGYMAQVEGTPAAAVVTTDHPGFGGADCSVWCVGTLESARGKGLATALMRRAMFDARERGCATTTLQATKLGRPVYERVGYRDFGPLQMWELRPPELAGEAQPKPAA
ncbi:MAG: GNAT family N-acetyltransferase [Solirubrobacterales bacterium]